MKKTRRVLLLLMLLFVVPLSLGMKARDRGNDDAEMGQETGDVLNTMLSSKAGADPLTLVAGSNDYLVLEHYEGLLILDRNFLEPVAAISAKEIGLKTQGDEAFSYHLTGDTLFLKRGGSGKSFTFDLSDKILREDKNEDRRDEVNSIQRLSQDRLEEILGSERAAQGIQGDDWIFVLIPDLNELGNTRLMMMNREMGDKRVKDLRDLAETRQNVSVFLNEKSLDSKGFVEKGRAYLPLRAILEGRGFEVRWSPKDATILIKDADREVLMVPKGEKYYLEKDGEQRAYDFYLREDRTYFDREFFKEIAGLDLSID